MPPHIPKQIGVVPLPPTWLFELRLGSKLVVRSRRDIERKLIHRALKDPDFKRTLIADPKAALEVETHHRLPDTLEYTVLEETDELVHLVLPALPHDRMGSPAFMESIGIEYAELARWLAEQLSTPFLDQDRMVALLIRIWSEPAFMAELLSDPVATLERVMGVSFGAGRRVMVFQETPQALALVLPKIGDRTVQELVWQDQEEELMVNILASPCIASVADPCGTNQSPIVLGFGTGE